MKLIKRKCPIEIKIISHGAGWTSISWFVPDRMAKPLILTTSYIGHNMGDFARALYYLYPNQSETSRADDLIETVHYKYDTRMERHRKISLLDEEKTSGVFTEFPVKAKFHWEEEPGGSDWTLMREPPYEPNEDFDFIVHVCIDLNKYKGGQFAREFDYVDHLDFDFKYIDLCYAVGKALTEIMKTSGFQGYWYSTSDIIDVIHLIFIKAIALGCKNTCKISFHENYSATSCFSDELELLLFDM